MLFISVLHIWRERKSFQAYFEYFSCEPCFLTWQFENLTVSNFDNFSNFLLFLKQPVFFHKRNTIWFNFVPAWIKLVKTHHHVKWFDYHLVCETLCSHHKSPKVTILNSRIRTKCFSSMEAGFVYDCSSGKHPIFCCCFFVNIWLNSDYLIFQKIMEILWEFCRNLEFFTFVFWFSIFTKLKWQFEGCTTKSCSKSLWKYWGCCSWNSFSKLKWVFRQNQATLE